MINVMKGVAHPWLCDSMGHLTTRNYLAMFDDASYHLFHEVFGFVRGSEEWADRGWADVKQVIEYKAEVLAGEMLSVDAKLTRIGGKSITALYQMTNINQNAVAATLESTTVFFDTNKRRAVELSERMRSAGQKHIDQ